MTDKDGNAQIIFNVWEEFIGYTVEVIGGYTDDCGDHHWDSIQITIVNEDSSWLLIDHYHINFCYQVELKY